MLGTAKHIQAVKLPVIPDEPGITFVVTLDNEQVYNSYTTSTTIYDKLGYYGYALSESVVGDFEPYDLHLYYTTSGTTNNVYSGNTLGAIDKTTFIDGNSVERTVTEFIEERNKFNEANYERSNMIFCFEVDALLTEEEMAACFTKLIVTTYDGRTVEFPRENADTTLNAGETRSTWSWRNLQTIENGVPNDQIIEAVGLWNYENSITNYSLEPNGEFSVEIVL